MDDQEFIRRFEDQTYPLDEWTHRSHVKIAFLYLRDYPFEEAIDRIRKNIKAFNAKNDIPQNESSGYNESTTQVFMRLMATMMNEYEDVLPTPTADDFCDTHTQLMNWRLLRLFYSPAQRKQTYLNPNEFVKPDLAGLPQQPDDRKET